MNPPFNYGSDDSDSSTSSSSSESQHSTGIYASISTTHQQNDGIEGTNTARRAEVWSRCVERGRKDNQLMNSPEIPEGKESRFQRYDDLAKWGWKVKEREVEGKGKGGGNWEGVLEMLGVGFGNGGEGVEGNGGWRRVEVRHERDTIDWGDGMGEKIYPVSLFSCSSVVVLGKDGRSSCANFTLTFDHNKRQQKPSSPSSSTPFTASALVSTPSAQPTPGRRRNKTSKQPT